MTPLKVLFVIDSLGTGGAEFDLAERLPRLAPLGIVPVVVALRPRKEGVQRTLQQQGFDIRILSERGLLRQAIAIRRIIRSERPDLVRTVLFNADVAGRFAAVGTGTPVVSYLVNTDYVKVRLADRNVNRLRFAAARWLDSWTARRLTAHFHANSQAVKSAAIRDLGIAAESVTVILDGRDSDRLGQPSADRRQQAREQLGVRDDQYVLVNVGRQDYQKGQRFLLEALVMLVPKHPQLVLLIAGRAGSVSAELDQLIRERHLEGHVRLLGHREDVPDVLAAADLFVFPSLYEGLPGAVMEAMALGLPIVATEIEPVRELVEEGHNALLVKPEAPDALATAIECMLADPEAASGFGRRSRSIFEERFALGAGLARAAELYRGVAARGAEREGRGGGDGAAVSPVSDSLVGTRGDRT